MYNKNILNTSDQFIMAVYHHRCVDTVFLTVQNPGVCIVLLMVLCIIKYTLKNIGSLEGTLEYYYHATPGEPWQGSPGVAW